MTIESIGPSSLPHDAQSAAVEKARRRAFWGHVTTAGCTVAATVIAFRRGRQVGFKKLFNSISAPKDFVYIGFLYGAGDVSQQLVTQARRCVPRLVGRAEAGAGIDESSCGYEFQKFQRLTAVSVFQLGL